MTTHHHTSEGLHVHGGNPARDIKRLGIESAQVIDFSVSISPLGPPEEIKKVWAHMIDEIVEYPDVEGKDLAHFFSKKYGISEDTILAGNGSTELIYLIPRALGLKRTIVVTPCFSDYSRALNIAGTEIVTLGLSKQSNFCAPPYETLVSMIEKADALIIGNPNNPTCTVYPREMLLTLAREFPQTWIIVDEAFIQFLNRPEEVSLVPFIEEPNIIVLHSLTKFYALAGLRMGCAMAHKNTIERLRSFKEPWTINGIAEKIGSLLLTCHNYEKNLKGFVKKERTRLFEHLKDQEGICLFPSSTNFFLCQWTETDNLDDLLRCLIKQGLYVRDCRNFPGLEKNFFRFAIRNEQDNEQLIQALSQCALSFL